MNRVPTRAAKPSILEVVHIRAATTPVVKYRGTGCKNSILESILERSGETRATNCCSVAGNHGVCPVQASTEPQVRGIFALRTLPS